ncbi:MAG TPA: SDR family NAD(P)-dependent oxidoreductase [Nocardioidaceae bacterium]|nr:SDR family NAD(P)-dependent oxidoreductase [Nocardioidaceae bacterium]
MPVAIVTGCSSGIGRAVALQLAASGVTTVATARRVDALADLAAAGCTVLRLDVTDDASRRACVRDALAAHGQVDVLVNNAGYAEMGPVEQVPLDAVRRQLETNVVGPVALTQLLLPGMRERGSGRIVNVSSMGGEVTFPGGGVYHASKYALEALSDALRMEAGPFGIQVVVVQPGPVATSFDVNSADLSAYMDGPYAGLARSMEEQVRTMTPRGAPPATVAAVVVQAATARRPHTRYRVGALARVLVLSRRVIPDRAWDAAMRVAFRSSRRDAVASDQLATQATRPQVRRARSR